MIEVVPSLPSLASPSSSSSSSSVYVSAETKAKQARAEVRTSSHFIIAAVDLEKWRVQVRELWSRRFG